MAISQTLFAAALASQVLGGNIISPPSRDVSGPATQKACGTGVATFLEQNPSAQLYNITAVEGAGYNSAACNVDLCAGYQFSDTPASHILYVTTSQQINITVNYTIPSKPLRSTDYYNLYEHMLTLTDASTGWPVLGGIGGGNGCGAGSSTCPTGPATQLVTHPSIDQWDALGYGNLTAGACGEPGQCNVSWQLLDFYRSPHADSNRLIDAGCVDVVIDWSTSSSK